MKDSYSIYEAKAKLSEIVRLVKQRRRITITERGKPVARVVPLTAPQDLRERIAELEVAGVVTISEASPSLIQAVARRSGAVARLLRDRD